MFDFKTSIILTSLGILMIVFCDLLRRRDGKEKFLFHFRIAGICTLGAGYLLSIMISEKGLPHYLVPLGIALVPCGLYLLINSFKTLKKMVFLGPSRLVINGVYRITRHPIYLGALLILVGGLFISQAPSGAVCIGIVLFYFLIAIKQEEKELYQKFGAEYLKYKKEVPMLIPVPRRKKEVLSNSYY